MNEKSKALKLKCVLFTEDGIEWVVIRQFYATDLYTNNLTDDQFAGMHLLKKIDKKDEQASGNKSIT